LTPRLATSDDAAKLALIGPASFLESFADDHSGDDMIAHFAAYHSVPFYEAALADPDITLWLVEEAVGAPIGYAMVGPATLPGTGADDIELRRIYILSRWHGTGLGRALFETVLTHAEMKHAKRLVLAVYTKNAKAQRFYERQGFVVTGPTCFTVGKTSYDDLVMVRPL
jgi:diamine N-acetyltransferase